MNANQIRALQEQVQNQKTPLFEEIIGLILEEVEVEKSSLTFVHYYSDIDSTTKKQLEIEGYKVICYDTSRYNEESLYKISW